MTPIRLKLLIAGTVLTGAFGYLAFAGMQKGWVYYVSVDQFTRDAQYHDQRVRLHGKVATDRFDAAKSLMTAKFQLVGADGTELPVVYRGVIPDLFESGRDVVVEGRRDAAGVFQADVLMTKCASKYEADSPHAATKGGAEKQS